MSANHDTFENGHETFGKEAILILDIGYIYFIYFIVGVSCTLILDKIFGNSTYTERTPTVTVILEIFFMFWLFGILFYMIKTIVSAIPYPLHGIYGFNHAKFEEVKNTWVFAYIFLTCTTSLQLRILFLYNRFMGTNYRLGMAQRWEEKN